MADNTSEDLSEVEGEDQCALKNVIIVNKKKGKKDDLRKILLWASMKLT